VDPELKKALDEVRATFLEKFKAFDVSTKDATDRVAVIEAQMKLEREARTAEVNALQKALEAKAGMPGYKAVGNPEKDFSLLRAIGGHFKKWGDGTKQYPEYELVHEFAKLKAQTGDVASEGGFLVSVQMLDRLIEELRPESVALTAGVEFLTGLSGNDVTIPKELGGITVARDGEVATISETNQAYGDFTLKRKRATAYTTISLSLLRQTAGKVQGYVERKMAKEMGLRFDLDFFLGAGAANVPLGILLAPNVGTVDFNSPAIDYAGADQNVTDKLDALIYKLKVANAYRGRVVFFCHPGASQKLRTVKDANGNPILVMVPDPMGQNGGNSQRLWGHPLFETTQLTGSGAGSHLICCNVDQCVMSLWDTVEIVSSEHVEFKTGKIGVRAIAFQDSGVFKGEAVAQATNWTI